MNECKIVEDLLPLYAEDLTGEETASFIREHVAGCENCRKLLSRCETPAQTDEVDGKAYKKALRKNQFNFFCKAVLLFVLVLGVLAFGCYKLTEYMEWKEGKIPVEQEIEAPSGLGKITLVDWEASGRRIGNSRNEGTLIRISHTHVHQDEYGTGWYGSAGEYAKYWENVQAVWAPNGEDIFFSAELLDGGKCIFVYSYEYWVDDEGSHGESKMLPMNSETGYMDALTQGCANHPDFPTGWETVEFNFYQWQEDSETITFVYETDNGCRGLVDFHYPSESVTNVN